MDLFWKQSFLIIRSTSTEHSLISYIQQTATLRQWVDFLVPGIETHFEIKGLFTRATKSVRFCCQMRFKFFILEETYWRKD